MTLWILFGAGLFFALFMLACIMAATKPRGYGSDKMRGFDKKS